MLNIKYLTIFITILGMEISWLYALLNATNKADADRVSIPLLMVILFVSLGVSWGLRYLKWPKLALTGLSWILGVIFMLLMIKIQLFPDTSFRDPAWLNSIPHGFSLIFTSFDSALLILLSSLVLWWFGRRLAYTKADFSAAVAEFQFGLGILIIVFFCAYELKLDQSSSIPVTLTFFALALLGISLSHARDSNSWPSSWQQGNWSTMLIVSIIIILLLGLLISLIFTPDLINRFLKALGWVWSQIDRFIGFLASLFPQQNGEEIPLPSIPSGGGPDEGGGVKFPEWLLPGIRLAWEILAAGVVLFAIYRVTSQIFGWMRRRGNSGGEVESLKGAFKLDFLNWLKRILYKIFRIKANSSPKGKSSSIPPEIASVRQLYSQFLHWAAEKGYPRPKSQTPNEYEYVLGGVIPENQEDLDFITREYVNARYGSELPTEIEVSQLKQKWQELKKKGFNRPENNKLK
jgi:hypothetical protein